VVKVYVHNPVYADGKKLRRLLEAREISVRELSEQSGVSTGVIYRLRRNRYPERFVELYNLRRLAKALGVQTDDLM
jgi:transcriptional regulator with XRE-family HTH domain